MKCLEGYTIEQVKEMTCEELKELWNNIAEEKWEMDIRHTIVDMIEVMNAKRPMIES
jgi:hypothetical protein